MRNHWRDQAAHGERIEEVCDRDAEFEKFATCSGGPHFLEGPAFDREGHLWVTGLQSGAVLRIDPDGTCAEVARPGQALNSSKFDAQGRLVIIDRSRGLGRFDPSTGEYRLLHASYGVETLRGLNDCVLDDQGGIYFTEPYGSNVIKRDGRVFYVSPAAAEDSKQPMREVVGGIAFPNGIALSPDGKQLYVAEYAQNRILRFPMAAPGEISANAVAAVFAYLVGGVGPDGMVVDAEGNVYAAQYNAGQVSIFDPSGLPVGVLRLPKTAGLASTNLAIHDGHLYVVEAQKDEIWRIRVNVKSHPNPNQR